MKHVTRQACNVLFPMIAALFLSATFLTSMSMATQQPASPHKPALNGNVLQFKAGNHIVGFTSEKAYFVTADHALSVELVGNNKVTPNALSSIETNHNKTSPASLGRVEYKDLWPGITLRYDAIKDGLAESTFIVQPGADVSKILLKYNSPITLQKDGSLKIALKTNRGEMIESAPVAWQEVDGRKVPVKVAFSIRENEIGFRIGKYDGSLPLIIDPIYAWHTFYGSSQVADGRDDSRGIAIDNSGNIYITGTSYSTWNGPGVCLIAGPPPCPLNPHSAGDYDLFVLKLNSSGEYQWHTFYGAETEAAGDGGYGIAVDGSGGVYVTGTSSATWGSPKHAINYGSDIVVLKLNSSGVYQWHTFFGSSNNDNGKAIAADADGNVYVTGNSPVVWYGWSGSCPSPNEPPCPFHAHSVGGEDFFVLKLDTNGNYLWHTFFGANAATVAGRALALDSGNSIYITGESSATWKGSSATCHSANVPPCPLNDFSGGYDIFVLRLNSSGDYQWHTFYGSSNTDYGYGIAVYGSYVYVTGYSSATWNGPGICSHADQSSCPLHAFSGGDDIVALKLNNRGEYQWHTFYGSNDSGPSDRGYAIAADSNGDIYLTGFSTFAWNGSVPCSTPGVPPCPFDTSGNVFLMKLASSGEYRWHTFDGAYAGNGIALDNSGNIYITGKSGAEWSGFPPLPLNAHAGGLDPFVLKFTATTCLEDPVKIAQTGAHYLFIQNALYGVGTDNTLLMQAMDSIEDLVTTSLYWNVTLQGGYECGFASNPGFTTIGSLIINKGSLILDKVVIK